MNFIESVYKALRRTGHIEQFLDFISNQGLRILYLFRSEFIVWTLLHKAGNMFDPNTKQAFEICFRIGSKLHLSEIDACFFTLQRGIIESHCYYNFQGPLLKTNLEIDMFWNEKRLRQHNPNHKS